MKRPNRLLPTLAAATVAAGGLTGILAGGPAGAASPVPGAGGPGGAVFVQTDNVAGNQVVAYLRGADGQLTPAGTYGTGGLGGVLAGSVVDHTASQGSLVYDAGQHLLYAVNAGSDTVSVFSVLGDRLALRQVISSGARSRSVWPSTASRSTSSTPRTVAPSKATCRGAVGWWRSRDPPGPWASTPPPPPSSSTPPARWRSPPTDRSWW